MIPMKIEELAKEVQRYGEIVRDKETEVHDDFYRTTHFIFNGGYYDICRKNGEIISFHFYHFP